MSSSPTPPTPNRSDRVRSRRTTAGRQPTPQRRIPRSRTPEELAASRTAPRSYPATVGNRTLIRPGQPTQSAYFTPRALLSDFRPTWRIASFAIVILYAAVLGYLLSDLQFFVPSINLAGAQHIPGEQIFEASRVEGLNMFWLDPVAIKANVEALPGIAEAIVVVEYPTNVTIQVTERTPVVVWSQSGQTLWVDLTGVTFTAYTDNPQLLRLLAEDSTGPLAPGATVPPAVIESALALRELRPNIESLYYEARRGLSYQDGRGWRGYFGVGGDMPLKLTVYETVIDELMATGTFPRTIDVTDPRAPVFQR